LWESICKCTRLIPALRNTEHGLCGDCRQDGGSGNRSRSQQPRRQRKRRGRHKWLEAQVAPLRTQGTSGGWRRKGASLTELKGACRTKGLPVGGTRAVLRARLEAADE
jgi:hypothetical protein